MEELIVRPVHAHEWREARALRLKALQDAAAGIAFLDTFDDAVARPDDFWQQRTTAGSPAAGVDAGVRQFVAIAPHDLWIGSVTVLVERAGETDFEGNEIRRSGGGIVGVYLDPAHRGTGVIQALFAAALEWVRERGLDYARLYVHAENARAQRAYRKAGFLPTGVTLVGPIGPEVEMAREL